MKSSDDSFYNSDDNVAPYVNNEDWDAAEEDLEAYYDPGLKLKAEIKK